MKTIYVVYGHCYEAAANIRAFTTRKAAYAFLLKLNAHAAKRPQYPDRIEDTPENDAAFEKVDRQSVSWRKRHPGGEAATSYEDFSIEALRLDESVGVR